MKKFALLSLISMPAFAHQVPFADKNFLKLTNGDPVAAQSLSWFCETNGEDKKDCVQKLEGGTFKQEAVLACEQKKATAAFAIKSSNGQKDIPGSRAHEADGADWHKGYERDGAGRSHRHLHTTLEREKARNQEIRDHIVTWRQTSDGVSGDLTVSKSVSSSVGVDQGVITQVMNLMLRYDTTTATEMSKKTGIPESVLKEAYEVGKAAYDNPSINGVKPSIICYEEERDCRNVPEGESKSNSSYNPNAEKKKKEEKAAEDKKAAENPPKHEDDHTHDTNDDIDHRDVGRWAGNDTPRGPNDPMIATPVLDDASQLTPMEKCVEKETKRLIDSVGMTTVDPNSLEKSVEDTATSLLKFGYCDVQVFGVAGCIRKRFTQNSVVAVEIQEQRKEAARQALEYFNVSGLCDPNALGREFCDAQKFKWETTPTGSKEINFESSGRRPFKTGDIPREWE
ncbi:MAG: hypothetical protein EOP10_06860 [Proteobacteria bacterium]|nr:MAG: hypothetical protein EOP10_06860 [Pseudomonadota bacterium]